MCGNYIHFKDEKTAEIFNRLAAAPQDNGQPKQSFHIHIYHEEDAGDKFTGSRREALEIARALRSVFWDDVTSSHLVGKVGPHTLPNYEIDITTSRIDDLKELLSALQVKTSILLHTDTDDFIKDHFENAQWFGDVVPFNQAFVQRMKAQDSNKPKL